MRTRSFALATMFLFFVALALPAWAKQLATTITLDKPATIAGKQLRPGDYRFTFDQDTSQLKVEQGDRVMAQEKAQWQDSKSKVQQSAVVVNDQSGKIDEVDFAGQKGVVKVK